jgi:hypothetical protein
MLVVHRTTEGSGSRRRKMMTHDGLLQAAHRTDEDSGILRWGGIAGIAGSVLFVVVFAVVGVFAGPEPAGPAGPIS